MMTVEQIKQTLGDIEAGRWPKGTVTDGEKRRNLEHFNEMLKRQAHEDECRVAAEALLEERESLKPRAVKAPLRGLRGSRTIEAFGQAGESCSPYQQA